MAFFHPANDDELYNLRAFDGTRDIVADRIQDNQEIVANWSLLGVEAHGDKKRVVLYERSSLAVAFVVGDGVHFGRAAAPTADDVAAVVRRYGLRWE